MDDKTYSISDSLEKNTRDKKYVRISEPTNGAEYLVKGNRFIYLSDNEWERGVINSKRNMTIGKKYFKGNECIYFGEVCNQRGDMVELFLGLDDYYLSYIHFERISAGEKLSVDLG